MKQKLKEGRCTSTQQYHCVHVGGGKPTYIELVRLQSQGRASPIASPLLQALDSVLAVAQHWLHRCTAAVARRPGQGVKPCLDAMAASVQRAQEQMEAQLRKLQVLLRPICIKLCTVAIMVLVIPMHSLAFRHQGMLQQWSRL